MWLLVCVLFLVPGSLSTCPAIVTAPAGVVAWLGSCLNISCRYDLCPAGPGAQLQQLFWIYQPVYDSRRKEFQGRKVVELQRAPGSARGDCGLHLPRVKATDAGEYGLRVVAKSTQPKHNDLLWITKVIVNVTDVPPAPHLWQDPTPTLIHSLKATLGCWVAAPCPTEPHTLTWEGAATKTRGAEVDTWTPPTTTTTKDLLVIGSRLAFEAQWYHDGTVVTCVLRAPNGTAITRASQQLQVNFPPRDVWVEMTPSSPVCEGEEVTLRCWDSAKPPSHTYTWTVGGRDLSHSHAHLVLGPVRASDAGAYVCQATNAVGTTPSPARTLDVYFAPRDLRVEVTPSSPVLEGQEVTLRCQGSANPAPRGHAWTLGGRDLHHGDARLVLGPVRASDAGVYACRATNSLGTATSPPSTLQVFYPPRSAVLEALSPLPPLVGTELSLRCVLGPARPAPSLIQWLRDGRPLATPPGPTLRIPARAGAYVCVAHNEAGAARSAPLAVTVWHPPRWVRVQQLPGGPVVAGGGRVQLRCQIGAAEPPKVTVTWFKNGLELLRPRVGLDSAPDSAPHSAPDSAPDSAPGLAPDSVPGSAPGLALDAASDSAPALAPDSALDSALGSAPDLDPNSTLGSALHLTPHSARSSAPDLAPDSALDLAPDSTPDLILVGPEPDDAGAYTCAARNQAGLARSPPLILDIRYAPLDVALEVDPSPRVREKTDVTLRCRARAHPPPSAFEWSRDGRPLGQSRQGLWVLLAVGAHQSGRYRCRVTNAIASVESDDVSVSIHYSTATIVRKTFLGLGVGLGLLLVLGTLGCFLRRRWHQRQTAADEEPVVEPSGTFFLRNKKPRTPGSPRPPRDGDDTISYSTLMPPPGSGSVPRLQGDTVVYTVLKRSDGAAKATEGPDYENVPAGPSSGDRAGDREGTLVYAALALSSPGTRRGRAQDSGDTVEYVTLKH